jgi:hypothetical protein
MGHGSGLGKGFIIIGVVILIALVFNPKITLYFAKIAQKQGRYLEATMLSTWFVIQVFLIVSFIYLPFYLMGFK